MPDFPVGEAQDALHVAFAARDVAAIEAATHRLRDALELIDGAPIALHTLEAALHQNAALRVCVNFLADRTRRSLMELACHGANVPAVYGRPGFNHAI